MYVRRRAANESLEDWTMRHAIPVVLLSLFLAGCFPEEWADVSPDGKALIVSSTSSSGFGEGVFWLAIDEKEAKRLADFGWCPKFSPDGRFCAFMGADRESEKQVNLVLYDLDTDTKRVLRSWPLDEEKATPYLLLSWKPDAKEIACVVWWLIQKPGGSSGDLEQKTELHIINVETGEDREYKGNVGINCSWSPDGRHLAFYRFETAGVESEDRLHPGGISLGSLQIMQNGREEDAAGLLLNPYASVSWLSDDRVLFIAPKLSLPCSKGTLSDVQEAVFVYDLVTKGVTELWETRGVTWEQGYSFLRVSPDRQRFLFGLKAREEAGKSGVVGSSDTALWCYDLSSTRKRMIAEKVSAAYPFWLANDRVGYFEDKDTIIIADIDEKSGVVSKRTLNLSELLKSLQPATEPAVEQGTQPAEGE